MLIQAYSHLLLIWAFHLNIELPSVHWSQYANGNRTLSFQAAVMTKEVFKQGAEARLYITDFLGKKCLIKERFKKLYRHPELERSLSSQRVKNEVRAIVKCRQCGELDIYYYGYTLTSNHIEL